MAIQFQYPQNGWSTGKMRKSGQKLAMDYQKRGEPQSALTEMEKAAGFGLAARGGAVPGVPTVQGALTTGPSPIDQHKAQIQDALGQVASGDMTSGAFKKMLKKLGWSGDHETGQFTDPTGQQHQIQAAEAQ
jgi:hypothetical protein